ncbi:MAG: hypothetical protein ACI4BD_01880 [Paludibacteraceae bacterium]
MRDSSDILSELWNIVVGTTRIRQDLPSLPKVTPLRVACGNSEKGGGKTCDRPATDLRPTCDRPATDPRPTCDRPAIDPRPTRDRPAKKKAGGSIGICADTQNRLPCGAVGSVSLVSVSG